MVRPGAVNKENGRQWETTRKQVCSRRRHGIYSASPDHDPPDDALRLPGANDPVIFADIAATLGRDTADVRAALAELSDLAGGPFNALDV